MAIDPYGCLKTTLKPVHCHCVYISSAQQLELSERSLRGATIYRVTTPARYNDPSRLVLQSGQEGRPVRDQAWIDRFQRQPENRALRNQEYWTRCPSSVEVSLWQRTRGRHRSWRYARYLDSIASLNRHFVMVSSLYPLREPKQRPWGRHEFRKHTPPDVWATERPLYGGLGYLPSDFLG